MSCLICGGGGSQKLGSPTPKQTYIESMNGQTFTTSDGSKFTLKKETQSAIKID